LQAEAGFKSQYENLQRQVNATIVSSWTEPSPTPRIEIQRPPVKEPAALDQTEEGTVVPIVPQWSPRDYAREQARFSGEIEAGAKRFEADLRKSEAEWNRHIANEAEALRKSIEQSEADGKPVPGREKAYLMALEGAGNPATPTERKRKVEQPVQREEQRGSVARSYYEPPPPIPTPTPWYYPRTEYRSVNPYPSSVYIPPRSSDVSVSGYLRKDGTYVPPHHRSAADSTRTNNFSYYGNVNPYTGKRGSRR
jgi:hypothetical protein